MLKNYLACSKLSYTLPDGRKLFENLDFDIGFGEKAALCGENGCGKSTLFKIISGELSPSSGTLIRHSQTAFIPQNIHGISGRIDEVAGIRAKLEALERISSGNAQEQDWDILDNDWDIEERWSKLLTEWGLAYLAPQDCFSKLSGGEKEKILIIKALLQKSDIILLDEPTNNLDLASKQKLWQILEEIPQGVCLITHDRSILNRVSTIWELNPQGLRRYGGNYAFYRQEKEKQKELAENKIKELSKETGRLAATLQNLESQSARDKRYGEKQIANRRYSRLDGNAKKAQADSLSAKLKKSGTEKIDKNKEEIRRLETELKEECLKIPLPGKPFLRNKLLEIKEISFSYGNRKLFNNFSLLMKGDERIAIAGANGSGKTTLIKLITGELPPDKGEVSLNGRAVYLNQELDILDNRLSLLDNMLILNPSTTVHEAHKTLANFKFRNRSAYKKAGELSGGERLRACLSAIFCTPEQPEMIILDEPTNNLDLPSQDILENALSQYQGALIAVSHDEAFLEKLKIAKIINLD